MAEVYLARDTRLGRRVALKVIQPDALGSKDAVDRFLFEARATARFNHPHIVTIYFVGEHEGQPYVALEYLEGQTLRQRLEQERPGVQESLRIGLAIAEALQAAHAEQIVHRDLKPENVWLARDGRLRVLDFGLARALSDEEASGEAEVGGEEVGFRTRGKGLRGTPAYMAPEQWREQETSGATDVWALGVLLFELLSGERPYRERHVFRLAMQVCDDEPAPALGDQPEALVALVARCLDKAPAGRPSAAEVADGLRERLSRNRRLPADASPFRGLLPFDERHSGLFFGRDDEVATFVERLRAEPLLPVIGPSGAGKSSFVRAGVIPRLRERGPLEVIGLRPGARPLETLAEQLVSAAQPSGDQQSPFGVSVTQPQLQAGGDEAAQLVEELRASPRRLNLYLQRLAEQRGSSVLLFVDQMEELNTLVAVEEREAFLQAVCAAADDPQSPVRVVLTLREEFLGRMATVAGVRDALSQITVLRSPGPEALEETLRRPVEAVGYRYDDAALVGEMVAEVHGEASCLPLLQFAGQVLWERRDANARLLRRAVHEELGGVAGALARHADGVLAGLTAAEVRLARAILLRLTTAEGARHVLTRAAVLDGLEPAAERVLGRLIDARLVTVRQAEQEGAAQLELVHEALVPAWGRLRRWIEESREELVFLEELGQAAELWEKRGRPDEEVWHGDALRDARQAVERCTTEVPGVARRFLEAGLARQERQRRRRRLVLGAAVAALVAIAGISVVVAVSFSQQKRHAERQQAEAEKQRAEADRRKAEAQREAARGAMARGDLLQARARLRLSLETEDSLKARALWRELAARPVRWSRQLLSPPSVVRFTPDGRRVAVVITEGAQLIDVTTREVVQSFRPAVGGGSIAGDLSPDGRLLALSTAGAVVLYEVSSGRPLRTLRAPLGLAAAVSFAPGGRLLASGHGPRILIWEVHTGKVRRTLAGHGDFISMLGFSRDGQQLASSSADATARVWDPTTGKTIHVLRGHTAKLDGVAFSPDGRTLVSASTDGTVRSWDSRTGALRRSVSLGQGHRYGTPVFSPDGSRVAVTEASGRSWILEASSLALLRTLDGSTGLWGQAFSPDGRSLVAAYRDDRRLVLWDLSSPPGRHDVPHSNWISAIRFSPDGRTIASASSDRSVRLWEAASGKQVRVLGGHGAAVFSMDYSPDGRQLAAASGTVVRIWDLRTASTARILTGHRGNIMALRFSPDGRLLATRSTDRTVRIWSIDSGVTRHRVSVPKSSSVYDGSLAFSPDSRVVALAGTDGGIHLISVATGAVQRVLRGHSGEIFSISFSPDGRLLASVGDDGVVLLWNLRSGERRAFWREAKDKIWKLRFHPDGKRLGGTGMQGRVYLWTLATARARQLSFASPTAGSAAGLAFSPDGSRIAIAGAFGAVRVLDATTGKPLWRGPVVLRDPPRLYTHRGWLDLDTGRRVRLSTSSRWQQAVERRALVARADPGGKLLCVHGYDGQLGLWDLATGRLVFRRRIPGLAMVFATSRGCVVGRFGAETVRYTRTGGEEAIPDSRHSVNVDGDTLLTSDDGKTARVHPPSGPSWTFALKGETSALGRWQDHLIVGYYDRTYELIDVRSRKRRPLALDRLPRENVLRMVVGPRDSLVLGFASGMVGIWDLKTGARLDGAHLHGEIIHLFIEKDRLYAATDIGSHLVWDLSALAIERCQLLRRVWRRVPVVWEAGRAVLRPPPADHPCVKRGP
jgi:WD40 repeat protein